MLDFTQLSTVHRTHTIWRKHMTNVKFKKKSLTYLGQPICKKLCISCGENIENNDILMIYEYENIRGSTVNVAVPLSKVRNPNYPHMLPHEQNKPD